MRLATFECRLKKYVYQVDRIALTQLRAAFKDDQAWNGPLHDQTSALYIFLESYFRIDYNDGSNNMYFDLQSLLLIGTQLCQATDYERSRMFYDIIQDNL